jgi:hypothetical protein
MSAPQQFDLTAVERASSTWIKCEAFLTDRLKKLREKNDRTMPPDETAQVRGEIAALKALLRLGREPMPPIDGS